MRRDDAAQLSLAGDVEESETVRQLLTDFYQEVSQDQRTRTPLFADQHLEQDQQNGYVSATACQRCHQQEYLQWSATRHAFAYETPAFPLYSIQDVSPRHTTGFGYSTGFQIGDHDSTLKGVQCETCHGPGKQHVGNPKKSNIRSSADTSLCLECHDTKHSPGFSDVVALHTALKAIWKDTWWSRFESMDHSLVDAGNFDGKEDLDAKRCQVNKAMSRWDMTQLR